MANIVQGSAFLFKIGDKPMGCQLDCSLSMTQDMETEDACKSIDGTDNIRWAEDKAGQKSWSMTINGKVEDADAGAQQDIETLSSLEEHFLTSNEPIEVSIGTNNAQLDFVKKYFGTAQITDLSVEFPTNGSATYSGTLTGVGKLQRTITPKVP